MKFLLFIAAVFASIALAGCNGPDTYYDLRDASVHNAHGTSNDCRVASQQYGAENVWRGLAGGKIEDFDHTRNLSREACFPTEAECQYWAAQMSGAMTRIITLSCTRGSGR